MRCSDEKKADEVQGHHVILCSHLLPQLFLAPVFCVSEIVFVFDSTSVCSAILDLFKGPFFPLAALT